MTLVHNWHLGRRMEYPYFESRPKHQFAAVFNINRCIACQTCTMACKSTWTFNKGQEFMWWNNVETKPYGGFPQSWDVKTLKLIDSPDNIWYTDDKDKETSQYGTGAPYGTYEGDTIFEVAKKKNINQWAVGYIPEDKEWRSPNFGEDTAKSSNQPGEYSTLPEHSRWFFYLQRICNHCTYPGCLAACPRKAIYKRKEDGIVLIDQKRCRGYRKCVEQCPYKKPMYRGLTRVSEKCIACYPRIEGRDSLTDGRPMETRCMSACVGQIRLQGFLDDNPKNPITWLIRHQKIALPLYPQFGTEPNIYYIPPRWAPRAYLRQMFGPGVDEAIEKFMVPSRELLAVMSLFRMTQTIVYEYKIEEGPKVFETEIHGKKFTMYNDTVIGFGEDGKEVVRTTVEEPIHIRPDKHYNSI
ncbi:nitrite:nitrate oxidoreductase subunit beta [Candidatus Kuenenia stuttgartiensis]|uniref:Nitrite oxidoreductase subunit B n=1 Tax=Kuenenia stuttgartiensis TaxID=174633 RepID=Q1PZD5_KUEST|nr:MULTISPECIES: 4Fe-4S dicluster domain-containing protein [Kuenenia]7B04_A Chain A, Nitrite oxidoreductase subunit B [Candidatus Kuenenia stuttgartiensis]7B04_D Chain D, Nitrite oxidoreductase subunit B [Candidatus Kuenenia stuttgartiensis]7B04_G Chain G, Nitrite oxidoreductase subunit B [Candidatus Kuenenia stuttgartiensis]7B04_J Chain J, Nitrite oxidoreductase subunit B [Candidatus Kuenenia stuttgartiensis]7B04_M Chain M, Nitrite oxidoreductase subunit B [Candidatus Kuenenia stuttgartiensi